LGAKVSLNSGSIPPHAFLFGEDPSRILISFPSGVQQQIEQKCSDASVPLSILGEVSGTDLVIDGLLRVSVALLSKAWRGGIPAVMDRSP